MAHSDLNIVSFKRDLAACDEKSLKLWERGSCSYADDSAHNQPHTIKTVTLHVFIMLTINLGTGDGGETGRPNRKRHTHIFKSSSFLIRCSSLR